jgi:hypothetical protein
MRAGDESDRRTPARGLVLRASRRIEYLQSLGAWLRRVAGASRWPDDAASSRAIPPARSAVDPPS